MNLETPLVYVKGVGPQRGAMLEAKGLLTVADLLLYPPFRYEDRTNLKPVRDLAPGEMAVVLGEVERLGEMNFRRGGARLFEMGLRDGSGSMLLARWFNGAYLAKVFQPGQRVALFGKVEFDTFKNSIVMTQPEFEILAGEEDDPEAGLHTGRIVPVYEAAGKVTAKQLRGILHRLLKGLKPVEDDLPPQVLQEWGLPDRWTALQDLHFPKPGTSLKLLNGRRTPAQIRMILEEFFWLECGLELKRTKARQATGIQFALTAEIREKIKQMLPFKPTGAQKRVLGEIAADMHASHPMNRLLQGDVGSGKTLVAAEAAVIAIENGYQVAVLAPTEILAAQHYAYFKNLFGKLGYQVALLSGSFKAKEKESIRRLLQSGLVHVVVGTHALLEEEVAFQRLGLAIIDEQHRFGVMQRLRLMEKGTTPDILVMTATPIPRTLALTIYGDLDTSVIDELPPGRQPIVTKHVPGTQLARVWEFVRTEVAAGRQAYVVYPVIEESETAAMRAAEKMYATLREEVFPEFQVGLLHGKLPQADKEQVMAAFKRGALQVLVSTTVIEVGVDVPNATVMVIEQAERFGLAQLHQLRGRVGRGGHQSFCILVTEKLTDSGKERMRAMTSSSDGFFIAEMDLRLRGPGEFFGTKQSGLPTLHFADILQDEDLLLRAREAAQAFIRTPPSPEALRKAIAYIREHWQRRYGLVQVG